MNWSLISIFFAMSLGVLLLAGDFSAISVALSSIKSSLNSTTEGVRWVILSYLFSMSSFLIACGRLSDLFGRKRIFLWGLLFFGVASLFGGLATCALWLVFARFFQGIGAAMLWTSIIGICSVTVPKEKKSFAIGLILGAVGLSQVIGPAVGSFFTQFQSWRAILLINVPLSLVAGLIGYFKIPSNRSLGSERNVDVVGISALTLALLVLIITLEQMSNQGMVSPIFWILLLISLSLFILLQLRVKEPTLFQMLLSKRSLIIPSVIMALISPAFFIEVLFLPHYMQKFLGLNVIEAHLGVIPLFVVWTLVSPIAGDLGYYMSEKAMVFIATSAVSVGAFLLGFVGMQSDYYFLLPGMIISGLGFGFGFASITNVGIRGVEEGGASLAGGILYTFLIFGGVLGLAVGIYLFHLVGEWSLKGVVGDLSLFDGFLTQAEPILKMLSNFSENSREKMEFGLHRAYARGFFATFLFCSILAAAGAILSLTFFKQQKKTS